MVTDLNCFLRKKRSGKMSGLQIERYKKTFGARKRTKENI